MDQDGTWHGDGDPAPVTKKGEAPPQFSAHFYCSQTVGCIKMPLGTEVGLCPDDIVLDGDPAPQFSARVYCGQTAVCTIRILLGTEVRLSLVDIVLDGDPAPPPLKGTAPNFRPMSVVAKRLDGLRCHFVWR